MSQTILETADDKFYQRVKEDFGKSKSDVREYVDMLLDWSKEQPHFPELPPINFCTFSIVACKFSLEKTKAKIDMYYTIRNLMPEVYSVHPLSPEVLHHSKVTYCVVLPKYTQNHERIIFLQLNPNYQPEDFKHEFVLVQFVHVLELIIQEAECYNWHIVFDWIGAKFGHLAKLSPMVIKKFTICFEKVYANRVASICGINFNPFLDNTLKTIFLPFMSEKLKSRIKICKNADMMFEMFNKSILPKDIGGEEKSLEELRLMMIEKFEKLKPRFDEMQYMASKESLRPSPLENDEILGYYGSFKQIAVD